MERNFVCFSCQYKPVQFTILHCDHIICSDCLENSIKNFTEISVVQCTCGIKTFCNQDSMRMSLRTPQMAEVKRQSSNLKLLQDSNTKISNFFIQQSDVSSEKQNTFLKNKENLNTENLTYLFNPSLKGCSKFFLKTQPLNIDESLFFLKNQQQNFDDEKSSNLVRAVKSVQSIKSLSPSQKVSEKVSPRKFTYKNTPKKIVSRIFTSGIESSSSQSFNCIAKQLQKQLKFLQIQYKKQLQTCEKAFNKVIKELNSSFQKMIDSLKKKYMQRDIQIKPQEKNFMILSMPQVIKQRYESLIGKKLDDIKGNIWSCLEKQNTKYVKNVRQTRQTVFLMKNIGQKSVIKQSNNSANRSKSKGKQCALYLAISPKNKNDKVVNYIDVIRKQPSKASKKTLIKKTIKGEKIRIY